jgi:hypothetical protein
MGKLEKRRKSWEHIYVKNLSATRRQLILMKTHWEKRKGKIVLMEVGEESNMENLVEQDHVIKELQEKVRHLELKQSLGFVELRHSPSPTVLVGSFGHEQARIMEEYTME